MQNHTSTQKIAIEVRGISVALENAEASRKRHDERSIERHRLIGADLKKIGEYIAASDEFRKNLTMEIVDLKNSVSDLVALKNQAKGGWWAMCTLSAMMGSTITFAIIKFFKP